MMHNNKRYSEEFKKQIVNLHLSGKSVKALANEYGLVEQTIYKWKKLYAPTFQVNEKQTISMKEYQKLQKKIHELKLENEILKKLQPYSPKNNNRNRYFHNSISK